jgi:hypothetical protein
MPAQRPAFSLSCYLEGGKVKPQRAVAFGKRLFLVLVPVFFVCIHIGAQYGIDARLPSFSL